MGWVRRGSFLNIRRRGGRSERAAWRPHWRDRRCPCCRRDRRGRVWMLPVSQGDFQTVLACVIGTGRVSGLCMWLRSATGRYGVRELGVQIDLSDFYVLDLYMVFPKLNVIIAPIIVCWSPHFTGSACCCYAGRNGSLFSVTFWRIAPDCPSNPALSSSLPIERGPFC